MQILGVRIDNLTRQQALALIERRVAEPEGELFTIATVNPECLVLAHDNAWYREVLNLSSLCLADGVGVVLAARLRGSGALERITGADLIYDLARACRECDQSLFLLGATAHSVEAALSVLRRRYPGLSAAGHSPPRRGNWTVAETETMHELIAEAAPAVLCVAFGMPRQELWIDVNRARLGEIGVCVAVGVGGAVDYVADTVPRAPELVRRIGMEWFYRLVRQPNVRFRRQITRLPRFALLATVEAVRERRPP